MSWLPKTKIPGADEDYGADEDEEPGQVAPQQTQSPQSRSPQTQSPPSETVDADDLSSLVLPITGHIEAPSTLMPDLQRLSRQQQQQGRIATFVLPASSPSPSPSSSPSVDDFELDFNALHESQTAEDMAHALSTQASVRAALASAPDSARNFAPNARLIAALTQPRADNTEDRLLSPQLMHLSRLIRDCENTPQLRRLLRLILSIEHAPNNERVLQRRLNQLNRILQTRRNDNGVTYSSQIRTLRCRSARARTRRSLHEFISRLRDQVLHRLQTLRRMPPPQPHTKGGTRKKMIKRNKTKKYKN
jgi:hypothetical protein